MTTLPPPKLVSLAAILTSKLNTVSDATEIKKNLIIQLTAPVRWTQSVQQMIADGASSFTEVGPGKVLVGLVGKINKEAVTFSA